MYVPSWSNNHPIGSTSDKSKSPAELKSVGIDDSVIYAAASGIELHLDHIRTLQRDGYVVVPNFLPQNFVNALRVVDFSRGLLLQTQNPNRCQLQTLVLVSLQRR